MIGFFKVIGKKSILLELQLLQAIKIYKIFHINLLSKSLIDLLTSQIDKPAILVIVNNKKR